MIFCTLTGFLIIICALITIDLLVKSKALIEGEFKITYLYYLQKYFIECLQKTCIVGY